MQIFRRNIALVIALAASKLDQVAAAISGGFCAHENEICICDGLVKYGVGRTYSKYSSGSIECSNREFGDPIHGKEKDCFCFPDGGDTLPSCAVSKTRRLLSASSAGIAGGHVVHVSSSDQIERAEVVAAVQLALDGGDGFEALINIKEANTHELLVLTKDNMQFGDDLIDSTDGAITDGAFAVQNAFIRSDDSIYTVRCPAKSTQGKCQVVGVDASDGSSPFGRCLMEGDHVISDECLDSDYTVSLMAFQGPHFVLGAFSPQENCPSVAFDSMEGDKQRIQFSSEDADGVAVHHVGEASLRALLESEKQAEGPTSASFDLTTNNCVHYAGSITRPLGITESVGLAEFVIKNAVEDPNIDNLLAQYSLRKPSGALRYLAARTIGGSGLLKEKLGELVYSQFIM